MIFEMELTFKASNLLTNSVNVREEIIAELKRVQYWPIIIEIEDLTGNDETKTAEFRDQVRTYQIDKYIYIGESTVNMGETDAHHVVYNISVFFDYEAYKQMANKPVAYGPEVGEIEVTYYKIDDLNKKEYKTIIPDDTELALFEEENECRIVNVKAV